MPDSFKFEDDDLVFGIGEEPIAKESSDDLKKVRVIAIIIILAVIVIVGFIFLYFYLKNATNEIEVEVSETITVLKNETVRDYKNLDVSYDYILNNTNLYEGQYIEVQGFLLSKYLQTGDRGGYYQEYIIDYFGNKIILKGLTPLQREYFEAGKRSEIHYNATGIFHKGYAGPEIAVQYIYFSERPIEVIESVITHEENQTITHKEKQTVPKYGWLQ